MYFLIQFSPFLTALLYAPFYPAGKPLTIFLVLCLAFSVGTVVVPVDDYILAKEGRIVIKPAV